MHFFCMKITRRQLGQWIALPSWKRPSRRHGLFAPSVTINFQRRPKPLRRIRSFSTWTMARMKRRIFRRAAGPTPCKVNWDRRRRNRNAERMPLPGMLKMCTAAFAALALFAPLAAQDRLTVEQARYDQETDPVRKARALAKLGDEQIDEARKQLKNGDEVASLHTLELYRDEVRHIAELLKATGVDPEKKPAGFKELQISLRETVRHIDDLILTLPVDKRPFFREVRTDLVNTQNELIDALFPRQLDRNSKKP